MKTDVKHKKSKTYEPYRTMPTVEWTKGVSKNNRCH
jgi:hypothetical protein